MAAGPGRHVKPLTGGSTARTGMETSAESCRLWHGRSTGACSV